VRKVGEIDTVVFVLRAGISGKSIVTGSLQVDTFVIIVTHIVGDLIRIAGNEANSTLTRILAGIVGKTIEVGFLQIDAIPVLGNGILGDDVVV